MTLYEGSSSKRAKMCSLEYFGTTFRSSLSSRFPRLHHQVLILHAVVAQPLGGYVAPTLHPVRHDRLNLNLRQVHRLNFIQDVIGIVFSVIVKDCRISADDAV